MNFCIRENDEIKGIKIWKMSGKKKIKKNFFEKKKIFQGFLRKREKS